MPKAAEPSRRMAGKPARQMAGKRSGKYRIKTSIGVTENDWSNEGTRRRAARD